MKSTEMKKTFEVTTPSDREIVMTRTLTAPRSLVYDAFTKPDLIKRWLLGPDGWSMPVCEVELRRGGRLRYVWRSDADGREFGIAGEYREVIRSERLVHAEKMDDVPGEALVTTTFTERDGLTTVTMANLYNSVEIRDMALESGMDEGVAKSFDRLAGFLESTAAASGS
jgi:uncharacterized protein YndB with AHSA1/START domain